MSVQELELLKTKLYNEFYEANKELFEKNPQEFAFEQRQYVEKRSLEIKYKIKHNIDDILSRILGEI